MKIECISKVTDCTVFRLTTKMGDLPLVKEFTFDDKQIAKLHSSATLEEMTNLPFDHTICFLDPAVAFGIFSILMLKPGNQSIVGMFIQVDKA
jgi:hypothetical protein